MRRRTFLKAGAAAVAGAASISSIASVQSAAVGTSASKALVLDCHADVGSAHLNGTTDDLTDPWDTPADAQQILRHAQQAGIDRTVICSIECVTYEKANEEVAALYHRLREPRAAALGETALITVVGLLRSFRLDWRRTFGIA